MIFNSYDFTNDLIVEEIVRSVLPNVINNSTFISGLHGSIFHNSMFGDSYVIVKCRIIEKTRNDVQRVMREIAGKLYSKKPSKLILRDEPGKFNLAIVDGITEVEKFLSTGHFEISFLCMDPFAYSEDKVERVNVVFNNDGTFNSDAIIELDAGTTSSITVHAGKSSEAITIIYPFTGTQKIVIDTEKCFVTINGNNAMKYLSLESEFFKISPGEAKVVANAPGTIRLRERFL